MKVVIGGLVMIAMIFVHSISIHAQDAKQGERFKQRVEKLKTDLVINDELATKVANIEKDALLKGKELRDKSNGDHEAMRPQMQAIRKDKDDKVTALLNKDQMAKYRDMEPKRGQGTKGGSNESSKPEK